MQNVDILFLKLVKYRDCEKKKANGYRDQAIVNGDFVFTRHEFCNSFTVTWLSEFRAPTEPPSTHSQVDTHMCVGRSTRSISWHA